MDDVDCSPPDAHVAVPLRWVQECAVGEGTRVLFCQTRFFEESREEIRSSGLKNIPESTLLVRRYGIHARKVFQEGVCNTWQTTSPTIEEIVCDDALTGAAVKDVRGGSHNIFEGASGQNIQIDDVAPDGVRHKILADVDLLYGEHLAIARPQLWVARSAEKPHLLLVPQFVFPAGLGFEEFLGTDEYGVIMELLAVKIEEELVYAPDHLIMRGCLCTCCVYFPARLNTRCHKAVAGAGLTYAPSGPHQPSAFRLRTRTCSGTSGLFCDFRV